MDNTSEGVRLNKDSPPISSEELKDRAEETSASSLQISRTADGSIKLSATGTVAVLAVLVVILAFVFVKAF